MGISPKPTSGQTAEYVALVQYTEPSTQVCKAGIGAQQIPKRLHLKVSQPVVPTFLS
jgi:hypothetical protein